MRRVWVSFALAMSCFLMTSALVCAQEEVRPPPNAWVTGKLERGQNLITALKNKAVHGDSIREAVGALSEVFDFKLSRTGDRFEVELRSGKKIARLRYYRGSEVYEAVFNGTDYIARHLLPGDEALYHDEAIVPDAVVEWEELSDGEETVPAEDLPFAEGDAPEALAEEALDPLPLRADPDPGLGSVESSDGLRVRNGEGWGEPLPAEGSGTYDLKAAAPADVRRPERSAPGPEARPRTYDIVALLALIIVAGGLIVVGVTAWLRRRRLGGMGLHYLQGLRLGGGQSVVMVEAGGRRFMLGVTRSRVTLLSEIEGDAAARMKALRGRTFWTTMAGEELSDDTLAKLAQGHSGDDAIGDVGPRAEADLRRGEGG